MTAPFLTIRSGNQIRIDNRIDQAFRKALMDGVPVSLRSKMMEALSVRPEKGSLAHSQRYFGAELQAIADRCKPLVDEVHDYLIAHRGLRGFRDWLIATGYTNEYRMIKVMHAWALMKRERVA